MVELRSIPSALQDGRRLQSRAYHLWSSEEIHDRLHAWADEYPHLVQLSSGQAAFGLPRAGTQADCPFENSDTDNHPGCTNWFITIEDSLKYKDNDDAANRLPEVLWSGCLHGDERVGPTAVMEATQLLLEAASCEAQPQITNSMSLSDRQRATQQARQCRKDLQDKGIDTAHRQWLARLVSTRRVVVIPTTNSLGYFQNKREENHIDPNRDFPYDQDPQQCMQTIAGRTVNELFQRHLFQISLTFHGGTEVVAYEWGAQPYLHNTSPDQQAQQQIANAYSQYSGSFPGTQAYPTGSMNRLVYYVHGGMEDWAYAGSWDTQYVQPCQPNTYGGYPEDRTLYNNSTLRAFNMLVETSHAKRPSDATLGNAEHVLNNHQVNAPDNGHVARNIRLALLAADVVEPYVAFKAVNDIVLSDDIVPTSPHNDPCTAQSSVLVPLGSPVQLEWTVGGGFHIDQTQLWFSTNPPPDDCQLDKGIASWMQAGAVVGESTGTGYFSAQGASPSSSSSWLGPVFRGNVDVSSLSAHQQVWVWASAQLDSDWTLQDKTPDGPIAPVIPPQSHMVQARTNPNWFHQSNRKQIQGRLHWYSAPVQLVIGDGAQFGTTADGKPIRTLELSNRFAEQAPHAGVTPNSHKDNDSKSAGFVGFAIVAFVILAALIVIQRRRQRAQQRRLIRNYRDGQQQDYQDEDDDEDYVGGQGRFSNEEGVELSTVI